MSRAQAIQLQLEIGIFLNSNTKRNNNNNNAPQCLSEAVREVGAVAGLAVAEVVCLPLPFVSCCSEMVYGLGVIWEGSEKRGVIVAKMNWSVRELVVEMTSFANV